MGDAIMPLPRRLSVLAARPGLNYGRSQMTNEPNPVQVNECFNQVERILQAIKNSSDVNERRELLLKMRLALDRADRLISMV